MAALRTISLRLRGTSTKELEEAGEDTTGVVESKSKLRTKIQGYTGIDILTDTGAYKSTYEILLEISKVWDDLTDQDRAGLLELIAGKTRSNTAAAILSNTKDLEAAYKSAMEAEGSALAENEKYLDSIQGRIDLFNNSIQTMWSNTLNSDVVKFFVNLGTSLVKIVDKFGLINTLVFGLMSYFTVFKKNKFDLASSLGIHDIEKGWFNKNGKRTERKANKKTTLIDNNEKVVENTATVVDPQIKASEELTNQLTLLKDKRQSLVNDITNNQQYEDFLGKRMAAGYDDAATSIDRVHTKNEKLRVQLTQIDQEIANIENGLRDVSNQANKTSQSGLGKSKVSNTNYKKALRIQKRINSIDKTINRTVERYSRKGQDYSDTNVETYYTESERLANLRIKTPTKRTFDDMIEEAKWFEWKKGYDQTSLPDLRDKRDELLTKRNKLVPDFDSMTKKIENNNKSIVESTNNLNQQADAINTVNKAMGTQNKNTNYLNIFENGLAKGAVKKLTYDTQQLSAELDKLNGMDNQGITQYIQNLDKLENVGDNTKLALAAYASTVKDGNYTVQGASEYVKKYNKNLAATSKELARARLGQALLNLAITALTTILTTVITKLVEKITSVQERFEKLSSQLSATQSELDSINSELDDTQKKIEELQNQGTLSFTDQEELDRLKEQNAELERQKDLKESIQKQQQKGVNSAAVNAANDYYKKTGKNSGKTTGEKAGSGATTGAAVGGAVAGTALMATGGAAGLATALGVTGATQAWNPVGWGLLIAAGIVAIGAAIGAGIGAASGMFEEKVGESMENMREQHEKLQEEYNTAQQKYAKDTSDKNYEKMVKAQEKLTEYESMMANHLTEMDAYYSQIDLSVYDSEKDAAEIERLQQEMNDFYDKRDQWLIQSGEQNAKSNAISRIFGENAPDDIKDLKSKIEDAMSAAKKKDTDPVFDFKTEIEGINGLRQRLYNMGLTITEVEFYFLDLAKAEKEAEESYSAYSTVKQINSLSSGVKKLKDAFGEIQEEGYVSTETLVELEEVFGGLGNAWEGFVDIVAFGTGSIKEATQAINELLEAYLMEQLASGPMKVEEELNTIMLLQRLGVKNAQEYVEAMQKVSAISQIASNIISDEKEKTSLQKKIGDKNTTTDKRKNAELKLAELQDKTYEDYIRQVEDEYQINLTAEEERLLIEKAISLEKQNQAILDQEAKKSAYDAAVKENEINKDRRNQAQEVINQVNNGDFSGLGVDIQRKTIKVKPDKNKAAQTKTVISYTYNGVTYASEDKLKKVIIAEQQAILNDPKNADVTLPMEVTEADIVNEKEAKDDIENELKNIYDQLGLKVDAVLVDPSDLVDDIQAIYDTLTKAAEEYKESQHFSIDTFQSLVALGPNYLALLRDENDQLTINKEAIEKVTRARMRDLAVQRIQETLRTAKTAAEEGNVDKLNDLIGAFDDLSDAELSFDATTLMGDFTDALNNSTLSEEDKTKYINAFTSWIEDIKEYYENTEIELPEVNDDNLDLDAISSAYSTLKDAVDQYNESGYLTLNNLDAILSLEPEYLAALQMENGQLSINQATMEAMIQTRLAEAKATVVQSAITQLNTLAQQAEAQSTNESATAASNAIGSLEGYANTLGTVAQTALIAASSVAIFNEAVQGATDAGVDQTAIDNVIANMETQLAMIDSVGANLSANFKGIVNPDKDSGDSALDKLQEKYERKIKNLDNRQTYLQNEVDRLEAEEKGVSKKYYKDQIDIEEKKLDLYEQQHKELSTLLKNTAEGSDEWWEVSDALWEVEHSIQESTLRMVEFRQSIIDLYKTAFDGIGEAYDNKDSLFEDRKSYLEGYMELLELNDELAPINAYNELIAIEGQDKANNEAKLESQQIQYDLLINSDEYKKGSKTALQAAIDMETEMRATEQAILDNDIALAQFNKDLKNLYLEGWDKVMAAFSNRSDFYGMQTDAVERYIARLEALNIDVPEEVYNKQIEILGLDNDVINQQLDEAYSMLEDIEIQYGGDSQEYYDKVQEINDLEAKRDDNRLAIIEAEKQIIENQWEKFDRMIERTQDGISDLQNISDLISDEDVANENGSWTKEGITSAGLLYQQMEMQKQVTKEYADEINSLNEQYAKGEISEKTYYERLQELEDGQWDSIKATEDAKDAIVDLYEARIDMIEEGIDKEIEAYQELIDIKKEELDAERDLYDFRKDVQKQTKDIAALERRLASMSGSTDKATIAERTKLEAELREAKEGLDDAYYTHGMNSVSNALDDEMEAFEKNGRDYIEGLRESIKDVDMIIEQTYLNVMANGDIVLTTLETLSKEKGFTINTNLLTPWQNASNAATVFKQNADISSLTNEDGVITKFGTTTALADVFGKGSSAAAQFDKDVVKYLRFVQFNLDNSKGNLQASIDAPWKNPTQGKGSMVAFSGYVETVLSGAVTTAQGKYDAMKNALNKPWENANAYNTWKSGIISALNEVITKAKEVGTAIDGVNTPTAPNYTTDKTPAPSGNPTSNPTSSSNPKPSASNVKILQDLLNEVFNTKPKLDVDGDYGPMTTKAVKLMQFWLKNDGYNVGLNGKYDSATSRALESYLQKMGPIARSNDHPEAAKIYEKYLKIVPAAMFAKGTLGTTRDQLAITDESWIGEEITLAAGKNGQLQYLKKGSAVMPADISANLVEWGKLNPNMMGIGDMTGGIQLMSNYVNKPEIKLDIENFLKVDRVDRDTLPELEKLMDQKIDTFAKQLNYSIKRFK